MSQSYDFVTALRTASAQAITILNTLQTLSTQAAMLGYPNALSSDAFEGDNTHQTTGSIAAALATYATVLSALQANGNAGMLAIYGAAA